MSEVPLYAVLVLGFPPTSPLHTVDTNHFIKSGLARTQLILRPHVVRIRPRDTMRMRGFDTLVVHRVVQRYLAHKKTHSPLHPPRTLGIGLRQGPRGGLLLMKDETLRHLQRYLAYDKKRPPP